MDSVTKSLRMRAVLTKRYRSRCRVIHNGPRPHEWQAFRKKTIFVFRFIERFNIFGLNSMMWWKCNFTRYRLKSTQRAQEAITKKCDLKAEKGRTVISGRELNSPKSKANEKSWQHAHMATLKTRHGKVMTSMLHKTYLNLQKHELVQTHNTSQAMGPQENGSSDLESSPHSGKSEHILQFLGQNRKPKPFRPISFNKTDSYHVNEMLANLSPRELFDYKMYLKYQDPNPVEVKNMQDLFPDPENIFHRVASLFAEAKGHPVPKPTLSQPLKNLYWKASLSLSWLGLTTKATHPEQGMAAEGAYLRMCALLQKSGLVYQNKDGSWLPVTSDKVVVMLETLVKYAESTFTGSKGKGVKIILEKVKNKQSSNVFLPAHSDGSLKSRGLLHYDKEKAVATKNNKMHLHMTWKHFNDSCFAKRSLIQNISSRSDLSLREKCEHCRDISKHGSDSNCSMNSSKDALSDTTTQKFDSSENDVESPTESNHKSKWLCTVHVGWPYPFTIHAEGLSLPSAQMISYMGVARKLKELNLLRASSSELCPRTLERLMLLDTQTHWTQALQMSWDREQVDKFKADAELFCDASYTGFGAYLLLKESEKVSWMSETWSEQDSNLQQQLNPGCPRFYSTLAELYALVVAIFSWKHKLRGRRLVGFCDNQTAVGFINSYMSNPIQLETCLDPLDHLVFTLQSTCLHYNIIIKAAWLERQHNCLADFLSKDDVQKFRDAVPGAVVNRTKAKKLTLRHTNSVLEKTPT